MPLDPRLIDLDLTDHDEPTDKFRAQLGILADNLMAGYLKHPERADAMLRRDGMTRTARPGLTAARRRSRGGAASGRSALALPRRLVPSASRGPSRHQQGSGVARC